VNKKVNRTVSEGSSLCPRETEQKLELSVTRNKAKAGAFAYDWGQPSFNIDRIAETEYMIKKGSIPFLAPGFLCCPMFGANRGTAQFASMTNG
jgi:hypothetical protein